MHKLPKLPSRFQDAFHSERAKAELEYAKRAEQFPHHPHFADSPLHRVLLIQKVFFAFCKHARGACQAGDWTWPQVAEAVDAAWSPICDFYVVREQGALSEEQKARFRTVLWRTVNLDPQWKQHLSDPAASAEGACATAAAPPKPERAADAVPKAEGVVLDGVVTEGHLTGTTPRHGPVGGDTTQGIAEAGMDLSVFYDIRWQVEEADCHSLEQFCKAAQSGLKPEELRGRLETYILDRFDNFARAFLKRVAELTDIDLYKTNLKVWFDICLLRLERDLRPEIPKAILRKIEKILGPVEGKIIGTVDRGKFLARRAHWNGEAIRRARFIQAGLLQIQMKRLEGMKTAACLREAYNLYPGGIDLLTEAFLTEGIPSMVFRAAVGHKWVPYPPIRSTRRRVARDFLLDPCKPSRSETVPQNELTETFGGYRVPSGYRAWFTRHLESRIAHWRADTMRRAAPSDPARPSLADGRAPKAVELVSAQLSPARRANSVDGNRDDRRAAVDTYIEEVFKATGKRITRTDIWKSVGDKTRAEFERWESYWYEKHHKKGNKAAHRRFTRVLNEKPHVK
jgi:hypothetical protein